jgi:hypothetical protein
MSEDGKLHICCRILSKEFIPIMQRNKYGRIMNELSLIGSLHRRAVKHLLVMSSKQC